MRFFMVFLYLFSIRHGHRANPMALWRVPRREPRMRGEVTRIARGEDNIPWLRLTGATIFVGNEGPRSPQRFLIQPPEKPPYFRRTSQ